MHDRRDARFQRFESWDMTATVAEGRALPGPGQGAEPVADGVQHHGGVLRWRSGWLATARLPTRRNDSCVVWSAAVKSKLVAGVSVVVKGVAWPLSRSGRCCSC